MSAPGAALDASAAVPPVRRAAAAPRMLEAIATIGLLQLLIMLLQLARTKGLAVLLGPELVGVMSVVDKLLAVVAQTASLSLPFAAIRFLPAFWERGPAAFLTVLRRMRRLLVGLALAAAAGGAAVTAVAPRWWGAELVPYRNVVLVAFATLPVVALVPFVQNAFAGRLQQNRAMLFALAHAAVFAGAALVGVWWRGLLGWYALYAVGGTALVAAGAWSAGRPPAGGPEAASDEARADLAAARAGRGLPPRIWKFSASLFGLTFVTPYAALFVQYQVLRVHGAEAAGWMQAAVGVALAVRTLLGSAHAVFLTPNVNRGGTPAERLRWADDFQKALCLVVGVLVPPLLLLPHVAVRLLYAQSFLPGAPFVAAFVIVEVLTLVAGVYQAIVVAFDHMAAYVAQNVAAQLLLVAVAALGVGRFGIAAAAAAGVAAQLLLYASTAALLWRRHGLRIPARNLALTGYVVAALALAGAVGVARPDLGPATLALKAATYAALLAPLAWFLTPNDRRDLRGHARRMRARLAGRRWAPQ